MSNRSEPRCWRPVIVVSESLGPADLPDADKNAGKHVGRAAGRDGAKHVGKAAGRDAGNVDQEVLSVVQVSDHFANARTSPHNTSPQDTVRRAASATRILV